MRLPATAVLLAAAAAALPGASRAGEPGDSPWEEVVFLPESGLSVLLERDPRGVLLDRASYLDLHRRARAARGAAAAADLPFRAGVVRADVEASVAGDRVRARMRLSLAVRGSGRETIPIPAAGSVAWALLDGKPASPGASPDGKSLLLAVQGEGPHEAEVEVVAPVETKGGTRGISLPLPAAPAVRWSLEVPGRVTATAKAAAWRAERLSDPDRTRVVGFPGAGGRLEASWREGDEGTDLPPLLQGASRNLVEVGEGAATLQALLNLWVHRRPRADFPITLPADLQVLGVDCESPVVLVDAPAPPGLPPGRRAAALRFSEPWTGSRVVLLRAARPLPGPGAADLPWVDLPAATPADRTLAVRFTDGLRGTIDPGEGAERLDPAAETREGGAVDGLLRMGGPAASARARSERPSVRLRAEIRGVLDLSEDGPWLAASFLYRPAGDRLYGVAPRLPAGFVPDSVVVSGRVAHHRSLAPDGTLSLVFPGGVDAGGAVAVTVRGRLPVEGWTAEDWSAKEVPFPLLDAGPVEEAEGLFGVAVPPGIEVREEDAGGMEPAAVNELRERAGFSTEGLTLGYRFRGGVRGGRARATRPPASFAADAAVLAGPEEDHLRWEASVRVAVQRSGVREVRIRVVPPCGDRVRVEGPDVAEKRLEAGQGSETWVVRFTRRVADGTWVALRADLPLRELRAAVPMVSVEGASREGLQVGVEGAGELEVTHEAAGLREADPADLASAFGPRASGLLEAWRAERGGTPSLSLRVARLPAAELPPAFADRVDLRTVLGADGIARTRLEAVLRNADRQALEVELPPRARLHTARVRGEAVRPVRTAKDRLLVPLVRSPEPFPVVLVYEEALLDAGSGAASLRAPELGLPGGRSTWTVLLPDGSLVTGASGDFAVPAPRPGTPLLLRAVAGFFSGGTLGFVPTAARPSRSLDAGAAGPPPAAAPATPVEAPAPEPALPEAAEKAPVFGKTEEGGPPAAPEAKKAAERIAERAGKKGIFGMDLRLLEAGRPVTASRLSPGGTLEIRWRSSAARDVLALLAGLLAFGAGVLARRRGIGAPTWTVLALGLFTAGPLVFAAADTAAWDGAAAGTLLHALLALVARVHRKGAGRLRRRAAAAAALPLLALLLAAPPARAAEEPAPPPPPPPSPSRVYVPYDPARPETLRVPERVFLPYERYRELWNAAHPGERIESPRAPAIADASYVARIEGRVLVVAARLEVDPLEGGLVALPHGTALDDLRLDGAPASAVQFPPGGALVVPVPRAAAPGRRAVLEATFRFSVAGREPGGAVKAALPPAPAARFSVFLPLDDPQVEIAAAGGWRTAPERDGTRLDADLGPLPVLDLRWSPRGADAAGGRVRWGAATVGHFFLRGDRVEASASVRLDVGGGTLDRVDLALPEGWEPGGVAGPAVASWTVAQAESGRVLRVRLAGAGPGSAAFSFWAVRQGPPPAAGVALPDFAAAGAAAEETTLRVAAGRVRVAAAEASGWERVEAGGEFGGLDASRGERVHAAWRRTRTPARLVVRADPLPGSLGAVSRQHLFLGADASVLRAEFDLAPGPGGLFEAGFALPGGWTLDEVQGGSAFPEGRRVRVVLPGAPAAARTIALRLRGPAAGAEPVAFPRLRAEGATKEPTEVLVSTAPGFAAAAGAAAGFDPVPTASFAGWPRIDPSEQRALAFRAPGGEGSLTVVREALRATVRPTVVADVTVLDDRAIVDALLAFEVRGGPARTFRFRAPAGVKDVWVIGDGLRETRTETVEGREVSTVTLQAPATGTVRIRALYEVPVPAGAEAVVAGPEPLDGDAARAFVFVRPAGDAEARLGEAPGLEPCDVADLPLLPGGLDPRRVLRFYRARDAAWRLPLRVVTHEMGDVPPARVHLVEAVTVVDRDGSARTRADARLFNRALGFLPLRLPAGTSLESVAVGGVPVRPVTSAARPGEVLLPVRRQSLGEESQVVSVTFSAPAREPGGRFSSLDPRLPEFPGVPVDATTWRVLLPEDRAYSFGGNLDPVEEVEVDIARAEAYAEDVFRLRKVFSEGSEAQQTMAVENIASNAEVLRQTLERAQSRLSDLDEAAKAGQVDAGRVAESRRKAQELAREIDEALKDVQTKAPAKRAVARGGPGGQYRGPSGETPADETGRDAESMPRTEADYRGRAENLLTREGQSQKQWSTNAYGRAPMQGQEAQEEEQAGAGERSDLRPGTDPSLSALGYFGNFDKNLRAGAVLVVQGDGVPADSRMPEDAPPPPDTGGGTPTPPAGEGGEVADEVTVEEERSRPGGGRPGGEGAAPGWKFKEGRLAAAAFTRGAEGGGGGGGAVLRRGVAGVVSLAPPLLESGRAYSFRKLDAGAELTIGTRPLGIARRLVGAALFLLLFAAVWLLRRRANRGRSSLSN